MLNLQEPVALDKHGQKPIFSQQQHWNEQAPEAIVKKKSKHIAPFLAEPLRQGDKYEGGAAKQQKWKAEKEIPDSNFWAVLHILILPLPGKNKACNFRHFRLGHSQAKAPESGADFFKRRTPS